MSNIPRHNHITAGAAMHARSNLVKEFKVVFVWYIQLHCISKVMLPINATHNVYGILQDSDASFTDVDQRLT